MRFVVNILLMNTFFCCLLSTWGDDKSWSNPFADAARREGLEFLMVKMTPKHFIQVMQIELARQISRDSSLILRASGSGIARDKPEGFTFLPSSERYSHQMIPLLQQDAGKYAHYLISSGDSICAGVRYRRLNALTIGLVFPVEVLDRYPFQITNMSTVASRSLAVGTGRGHVEFDSTQGSNAFGTYLKQTIANKPHPHSFDTNPYFEFHFDKGIQLNEMTLLWIPPPLFKWFKSNPWATTSDTNPEKVASALSQNQESYELQISVRVIANSLTGRHRVPEIDDINFELIRQFKHRLKIRKPSTWTRQPGDWADVTPIPLKDGIGDFDPASRVGKWFDVVPDWQKISQSLAAAAYPPLYACELFLISK